MLQKNPKENKKKIEWQKAEEKHKDAEGCLYFVFI